MIKLINPSNKIKKIILMNIKIDNYKLFSRVIYRIKRFKI